MSRIERPLYGRFKKRGKIFNKNTCYSADFNDYCIKSQNNTAYKRNYTAKHFQIGDYTDSQKLIVNHRRILIERFDIHTYNDYYYDVMSIHNNYNATSIL